MGVWKPWWFNIFNNDSALITNYFITTRSKMKGNFTEFKRKKELYLTCITSPSDPLRLDSTALWILGWNYWNIVLFKIYFPEWFRSDLYNKCGKLPKALKPSCKVLGPKLLLFEKHCLKSSSWSRLH